MKKRFYPAVFHQEETGYSVSFPDIDGCFTQGDTLEEALEMSVEALGLTLDNGGKFVYPKASAPKDIKTGGDDFIMMIAFDELEYRKRNDNRAVKKTLTIPSWLNVAAEDANINFSQTLQNALKQQLDIDNRA